MPSLHCTNPSFTAWFDPSVGHTLPGLCRAGQHYNFRYWSRVEGRWDYIQHGAPAHAPTSLGWHAEAYWRGFNREMHDCIQSVQALHAATLAGR